jgi:hypothetical protein
MSGVHAKLSPSGASGWMNCVGYVSNNTSSHYANEGTAAHHLASITLDCNVDAITFMGDGMETEGEYFEFTQEMCDYVQQYVNLVRSIEGSLLVEQSMPITFITGEKDAKGTSDAVIIDGNEIAVVDLKYGMGIRVDAEDNPQLMMYGAAAAKEFEAFGPFETVRVIISQPRLNHTSEFTYTMEEIKRFVTRAGVAAQIHGREDVEMTAGEDQCRWCVKSGICEAQTQTVMSAIADDFVDVSQPIEAKLVSATELVAACDLNHLANCMNALPLIEGWMKAVRARVERELFEGKEVRGWKVVEGKRGNRAWADEERALAALILAGVNEESCFKKSLLSPAAAEKLLKGNEAWAQVANEVTQAQGSPSVAPATDRRPALDMNVANQFLTLGESK